MEGSEEWELWLLGSKGDRESWMGVADAGYMAKVSAEGTARPVDVLTKYRAIGLVGGWQKRER